MSTLFALWSYITWPQLPWLCYIQKFLTWPRFFVLFGNRFAPPWCHIYDLFFTFQNRHTRPYVWRCLASWVHFLAPLVNINTRGENPVTWFRGCGKFNSGRIFQEKKSVRPTYSAEHIYGGTLLAMCSNDFICFYDWVECRLIRRIDVSVKVSLCYDTCAEWAYFQWMHFWWPIIFYHVRTYTGLIVVI